LSEFPRFAIKKSRISGIFGKNIISGISCKLNYPRNQEIWTISEIRDTTETFPPRNTFPMELSPEKLFPGAVFSGLGEKFLGEKFLGEKFWEEAGLGQNRILRSPPGPKLSRPTKRTPPPKRRKNNVFIFLLPIHCVLGS
jgi:hypothetical protein